MARTAMRINALSLQPGDLIIPEPYYTEDNELIWDEDDGIAVSATYRRLHGRAFVAEVNKPSVFISYIEYPDVLASEWVVRDEEPEDDDD